MLVTIEWPALLLGAIGAVALWRRKPLFAAFLIWDFLLSLAVYSWAGEKFAWLVLHPLLPVVLLAGAGDAGDLGGARRVADRGLAGAALALLYVGVSSWWVNVDRGADPREMLVSTQSSTQVKDVADQVLALAASRGPGEPPLTRDGRLRRGRDLPLRLVLPPPADGLHRPPAGERRAAHHRRLVLTEASQARGSPPRSPATTAASSTSASGGCATTARSRRPANACCATSPSARSWNRTGGMKDGSTSRRASRLAPRPSCR